MALFSFTQPNQQNALGQQTFQDGMNQYQQQGQNLISPGQVQLAQSNPISMAGRQALGGAFQHASQTGTPANMQQMSPDIATQSMANGQGPTMQNLALARQLQAQQPQPSQNPWTVEAQYPQPNFGGKQGVWGG